MVGKLLIKGMVAGLAAGLLTFAFAKIAGEPQVDRAVLLDAEGDAAKGEATEPELVSRDTQAGAGLLTGVIVFGTAMGGLFALTFAVARGRVGKLDGRALSALLAAGGFVVLAVVPALKYPANPPSVGEPETIAYRTALYFLMIAVSVAAAVLSVKVRYGLLQRLGGWNASLVGGALFVAIVGAVMAWLPAVDEVPNAFPAPLLWNFRVAAVGMQFVMWTTLGAVFGTLVDYRPRRMTVNAIAGRA